MLKDSELARINELAHKRKTIGLTEEERIEQAHLREKFLMDFRERFRSQLDNIEIVEPDDPRLEIRYTVKWSMDRFDSEEAFDFLHRIFNTLLDDVTVKAREDGVFIFEQEFGILEDGDYDRRLFTYKNEQDMPVDLLLDNHLIVDPFLEETNSFFSQMQESLPTILAAILAYSEKMQDMNRELFLSEDNDTEQGLMGLDFFKAYQSEIEDA